MSGVTPLIDTLLATRLAQRVDLVPLKAQLEVAGPGGVTNVEKVSNDVRLPSREALQRQLAVALFDGGDGVQASSSEKAGGSVTLSAAARAVNAILNLPAGTTPAVRGAVPLWPDAQPPAVPVLAATLARTVSGSGLFYESHLQQYAAGTRTLAQLAQEPQSRLAVLEKMPPALRDASVAGQDLGPAGRMDRIVEAADMGAVLLDATAAPSDAGAEPPLIVRPGAIASAVTVKSGEADIASGPIPQPVGLAARPDPANLAATYGRAGVLEKEHAPVHDIAGQELTEKNSGASSVDALRNNTSVALGIHPDAIALVRQQLELLAVPVFRWGGEVWPGTPMDWEIRQEQEESQAAADSETVQRTWTTRLTLTLPTLGAVEVRLSLAGATLQVHLAARENTTLALLSDGRNELPQRFGSLGLQLTGLQIGVLAVEPAAQNTRKDDHAA